MKSLPLSKWPLSFPNLLFLLAIVLGTVALAADSTALMNGARLVWNSSGFASLALVPLTLLLASTVLRDVTEKQSDQESLKRHYRLVAGLSPMAGFLGTVLGIMGAIQSLGTAGDVDTLISMVDQVFGRMGIAFTTTAWGLVLAMIAVLMLRLKKEESTDIALQLGRIASLLQVISSDLNDIRPVARRQVMKEHTQGENRYETIHL